MSSRTEPDTDSRIARLVTSLLSRVARRYGLQYADQQDLRQAATLAAYEALPRYKATTGTLEAFLAERVGYAMVDEIDNLRSGGLTGDYSKNPPLQDIAATVREGALEIATLAEDGDYASHPFTMIELLPDDSLPDPVETIFTEQVLDLVRKLPPLQARILVRYYGLFGCTPHTQRELASHYRTNLTDINRRIQAAMESLKLLADPTT